MKRRNIPNNRSCKYADFNIGEYNSLFFKYPITPAPLRMIIPMVKIQNLGSSCSYIRANKNSIYLPPLLFTLGLDNIPFRILYFK